MRKWATTETNVNLYIYNCGVFTNIYPAVKMYK